MKGQGSVAALLSFEDLLEIIGGILFFVWLFYNLYSLASSTCWAGVNEPFRDISDSMSPGRSVDVRLDPQCLEKLVITRSDEKCRELCGPEKECSQNCQGNDRTYFITVKKEDDSGMLHKGVNWVIRPVEMVKKTYLEHSEVYTVLCTLDKETIECVPGDDIKEIQLYIDGSYKGSCSIKEKKGVDKLPSSCKVVK